MAKIGGWFPVLVLLAASCAGGRAERGEDARPVVETAPAGSSLVVAEGTEAAYVAGEVVVRLAPGAEPPSEAGPYHCSVAVEAGGAMVLLRCVDDAGELAPMKPLREALEAHPSVVGTEPNWIRGR
jgi:hypothetical protein